MSVWMISSQRDQLSHLTQFYNALFLALSGTLPLHSGTRNTALYSDSSVAQFICTCVFSI